MHIVRRTEVSQSCQVPPSSRLQTFLTKGEFSNSGFIVYSVYIHVRICKRKHTKHPLLIFWCDQRHLLYNAQRHICTAHITIIRQEKQ